MFEHLVSQGGRRQGRTLLASFLIHFLVVAVVLAAPLWFFRQLPAEAFITYLAEPPPAPAPPPPPPAPAPQSARDLARARIVQTGFTEPAEIPREIPDAPEDLPSFTGAWMDSAAAGIPGGVPAGVPGGAPLGLTTGTTVTAPGPPPPPPARSEPLKVGTGVQSAKLIRRVEPVYPRLAVETRVQGKVLLQAVVDEAGRVTELKVISGHPLLTPAALEAVRQWRYSPTLLNGEPVPVVTTISVIFRLR